MTWPRQPLQRGCTRCHTLQALGPTTSAHAHGPQHPSPGCKRSERIHLPVSKGLVTQPGTMVRPDGSPCSANPPHSPVRAAPAAPPPPAPPSVCHLCRVPSTQPPNAGSIPRALPPTARSLLASSAAAVDHAVVCCRPRGGCRSCSRGLLNLQAFNNQIRHMRPQNMLGQCCPLRIGQSVAAQHECAAHMLQQGVPRMGLGTNAPPGQQGPAPSPCLATRLPLPSPSPGLPNYGHSGYGGYARPEVRGATRRYGPAHCSSGLCR